MTGTRIIGLCGNHGVGKTSVARTIAIKHHGTVVSFSSIVKDLAVQINPSTSKGSLERVVALNGWDIAKRDPAVRSFIDDLGSTIRRLDQTYVIDKTREKVLPIIERGSRVVILDDVYLASEASMVTDLGGITVRIERDVPHSSYGDEIDCQYAIVNNKIAKTSEDIAIMAGLN